MVVGAFGPWAKALGLTVSGTDGSNDGWLVALCGGIGLALLLVAQPRRRALYGCLLAGVAGLAVTVYDRNKISDAAADAGPFGSLVEVGWGLNLAMVASGSLAVHALYMIKSGRSLASTPSQDAS